jgi:hypothetical protein
MILLSVRLVGSLVISGARANCRFDLWLKLKGKGVGNY